LVIRERIPEKHLGSHNLCDDRTPEQTFRCGTVHLCPFQQLRTMERHHRKLKAPTIRVGHPFCISLQWQIMGTVLLELTSTIRAYGELQP
jgi:hypothetical protein